MVMRSHPRYWEPWAGMEEYPVDAEALEAALKALCSSLLLTAGLGVVGQALPFNPCSCGSSSWLQPVWLWISGLSGCKLGAVAAWKYHGKRLVVSLA